MTPGLRSASACTARPRWDARSPQLEQLVNARDGRASGQGGIRGTAAGKRFEVREEH
jgi:hypothetical protein